MATVVLYHPKLQTTTEQPEEAAPVLKKSGWTTNVPKPEQPEKKEGK